jgi:hypothetical protein
MSAHLDERARTRLLAYIRELQMRVEVHEPIDVLIDALNPAPLQEWLERRYPDEPAEPIITWWQGQQAAAKAINMMSEAFEDATDN